MSPRPQSGPRLQRMLAIVPWVLAHPGVTIADLARRFEIGERELERDLALLPMCGLPPYTADRLIDVWVAEDGAVSIRLAEYFERPLRLTPGEGVALLAAGRALLAVPGADPDGPLASALEKLEGALGARGRVAVDVGGADHLSGVQDAVRERAQLEIDYYSFARDDMTNRVVDPARVFHAFGAWYLAAFCHRAGEGRLFRIDRILGLRRTGRGVEAEVPREPGEAGDLVYQPSDDDLRVRIALAPEARWVAENLPTEHVVDVGDGALEVVLAVSAPAFLERLMLGLGGAAKILGPPEAQALVSGAARRVLRRYGDA